MFRVDVLWHFCPEAKLRETSLDKNFSENQTLANHEQEQDGKMKKAYCQVL